MAFGDSLQTYQERTSMDPISPEPETVRPSRSLLAQAAILARKGFFTEASRLLRQSLEAGECSDIQALDLQARMFAQQGMLLRAEGCWTEALRHEPGNSTYLEALATLRRVHDPLRQFRARLFMLAVVLCVATALWIIIAAYQSMRHQQEDSTGRLAHLEQSLHELGARQLESSRDTWTRVDAVSHEIQQLRTDTLATIAGLQTAAQAQEQSARLAAAHQSATDQIAADMQRHYDRLVAELSQSQNKLWAALSTNREEQTRLVTGLIERLHANETTLASLSNETRSAADSLTLQLNASISGLQGALKSINNEIGRILWFRRPSSVGAESNTDRYAFPAPPAPAP